MYKLINKIRQGKKIRIKIYNNKLKNKYFNILKKYK